MSLRTRFSSWFFQVAKSSLTNFYCFSIHAFISLRKEGIPRKFLTRCRERVAVYCVRVSKLQLFSGPRKPPLTIETIEFC